MNILPKQVIDDMLNSMYKSFVGLPNGNPIVRNNTIEDAFTLVILNLLYKSKCDFDITPQNIDKISKIIVAPPDDGIDLFIEIEDNNEYTYHIIQAKYSYLSNTDINECFAIMKRTIKSYLRNPMSIKTSLRNVISETNFNKETYNNGKSCHYIVVHKGDLNFSSLQANNEDIVTINDLVNVFLSLQSSADDPKVPYDEFKSDAFNNFVEYTGNNIGERALLCNLRGYDLAILCNKYISSTIGRNILFGQNLRESLEMKSRTYEDMCNTINNEPHRFWHYNNGITILAESVDIEKDSNEEIDTIKLKNFSIINGAQTTSALGKYYKEAKMHDKSEAIENLRKVFVLARIMEVNNDELRDRICIYNNSQNPISTRDMVSTRREQKLLQNKYMSGEKPNIYIEIRNGSLIPSKPRFEKHQQTNNETLAQLAYAAFLLQPFSAKDKKKKLFNKDNSEEYPINEDYHRIFYYPETESDSTEKGVLFRKDKKDIDEVLFVRWLYKEANKYYKKTNKENQQQLEYQISNDSDKAQQLQEIIDNYERNISISSICMFYCITYYYEIKDTFQSSSESKSFNYDEYYRNRDKKYRNNIIKDFAKFYLSNTIVLISKIVGKAGSVNNWIRNAKSQSDFQKALTDEISSDMELREKHTAFVERYMI